MAMHAAGSLASSFLAILLLSAAAGKLADRAGFRRTLGALGLPGWSHSAVLVLLVGFELLLGLAVLVGVSPDATRSLLAGAMISFFAMNVVGAKRMGGLECRCFGQLSRTRFGTRAVAGTTGLVALAAFALVESEMHHGGERRSAAEAALLVAAGLLFAVACLQAAKAAQLVEEARTRDSE